MSDFPQDFERLRNGEQAAALIVSRSKNRSALRKPDRFWSCTCESSGDSAPLISSHTFNQAPAVFLCGMFGQYPSELIPLDVLIRATVCSISQSLP